jgi:hypothetical protein
MESSHIVEDVNDDNGAKDNASSAIGTPLPTEAQYTNGSRRLNIDSARQDSLASRFASLSRICGGSCSPLQWLCSSLRPRV